MLIYTLPKLPFAYDALKPFCDEKTLKVHHGGHHATYVEKLNAALENAPDYRWKTEELLVSLPELPVHLRKPVKENAGGHANHTLFWTILSPVKMAPSGDLNVQIQSTFGSLENFKAKFTEIAKEHFASGWAWLCAGPDGLSVFSEKDHHSPLTDGLTPLLVLDLWEHAYYLQFQNKRPDYIQAFWNHVNWKEVGARWDEFRSVGETHREWDVAA